MSHATRARFASCSKRLAQAGTGIALSSTFFGCFDARVVSTDDTGSAEGAVPVVPALLIDDFEDKNRVPSDLRFGPWRCHAFNSPDTPDATCGISSPGSDYSDFAYSVDFIVADLQNGRPDYPGVALESLTTGPVDLSKHERLVLSAKLDKDCKSVPTGVYLQCSGVRAADPGYQPAFIHMSTQMLSTVWEIAPLNLSKFQLVTWNGPLFDKQSCLRQIDGIRLSVEPDLADGEGCSGRVTIDGVYFQ